MITLAIYIGDYGSLKQSIVKDASLQNVKDAIDALNNVDKLTLIESHTVSGSIVFTMSDDGQRVHVLWHPYKQDSHDLIDPQIERSAGNIVIMHPGGRYEMPLYRTVPKAIAFEVAADFYNEQALDDKYDWYNVSNNLRAGKLPSENID